MNQDEDEILSSFFTLLNKVRDVLFVNRPELLEFIKSSNLKLVRDPFGRFFQIVLYIGAKKRVSMKEFATYFKLKAGTATGIIDQLVKRDLLKREANPTDRRKVELILTNHGEALYAKAVGIQKDEIRSVLDSLNSADIGHLKRILKKVNSALIIEDRTSKN